MPQESKPNPKRVVAPSPLERIFSTEKFSPAINEGIEIARKEMPNMAPVQPYGFFSRLAGSGANAYVTGGKNIYMNSRAMEGQSPQDVADVLTHEQEHVKQKSSHSPAVNFLKSIFRMPQEPYHRRPEEMAAYQAEKDRQDRMGRERTFMPSFSTGEFRAARDIHLPAEKIKRR